MSAPLRRNFKIKDMKRRAMTTNEAGRKIGSFEGYLAVYGNRDFYDSMLKAGCFTKSLQERDIFPLLADHDPSEVIGRFRCEDDNFGLKIFADVFLDIEKGMDKWIALEGEAIDGLSIGFSIVKRDYDEEQELLVVLEGKIWEGSVVTFQANELAGVTALRSLDAGMRLVVTNLLDGMAMAARSLPEDLALAASGDKPMSARVERMLLGLEEQIEALRAAAASKVIEPPQGHSDDLIDQESRALLDNLLSTL